MRRLPVDVWRALLEGLDSPAARAAAPNARGARWAAEGLELSWHSLLGQPRRAPRRSVADLCAEGQGGLFRPGCGICTDGGAGAAADIAKELYVSESPW